MSTFNSVLKIEGMNSAGYTYKKVICLVFLLTLSLHNIWAVEDIYRVPFTEVSGLILLEGGIDGHLGYFIYDTGADAVLVNDPSVSPTNSQTTFESLNGAFNSQATTVLNFKIGNFFFESLDAYAQDLTDLEDFTNKRILGIVGINFFRCKYLKFDAVNGYIDIISKKTGDFDPKRSKDYLSCPFILKDGFLTVNMENQGGDKISFILDSGATISIIDQSKFNLIEVKSTPLKSIDLVTASGKKELIDCYRINGLSLNNESIDHLDFAVMDMGLELFEDNNISGILSLSDLPFKEMIFDFLESKIYFKQASSAK